MMISDSMNVSGMIVSYSVKMFGVVRLVVSVVRKLIMLYVSILLCLYFSGFGMLMMYVLSVFVEIVKLSFWL